jgi:hypothetical protein
MSQQGDSQESNYTRLEYPTHPGSQTHKQTGAYLLLPPDKVVDLSPHSLLSAREITQVTSYPLEHPLLPQTTRTKLYAKFLKLCPPSLLA